MPAASRPPDSRPASRVRSTSPIQPRETAMASRKITPSVTARPPTHASTRPPSASSRSSKSRSMRRGGGGGGETGSRGAETRGGGGATGSRGAGGPARMPVGLAGGVMIGRGAETVCRGSCRTIVSSAWVRASSASSLSSTFIVHLSLLTDGRQGSKLLTVGQHPVVGWTQMSEPAYTRLHVDAAPQAVARRRRGAVRPLLLRRALDGEDRARGRDLEGAALPLLPVQAGVLPGDARAGGGRARARPCSRTPTCRRSSS